MPTQKTTAGGQHDGGAKMLMEDYVWQPRGEQGG